MPKSKLGVGLLSDNRVGVRQNGCDADRYSAVKWQLGRGRHTVFTVSAWTTVSVR